jgi:hypothetical protein
VIPRSARPAWAERFEIGCCVHLNERSGVVAYSLPIVGRIDLHWCLEDRALSGEILVLHLVVRDSARMVEYTCGWQVRDLDGVSDRYRDDETFAQLTRLIRDCIKPKG